MEDSLIKLIEKNKEKYYRIAYAYVKNKDDALDIIHNAVVKAIQKTDTVHNKDFIETWFYRILVNESISHIRKNRRIIWFDDLKHFEIFEKEEIECDNYLSLYDAMDRLSPKLKTVVILRFFEDMKLEEIADVTSTKLSTVKARLYKALELLKNYIEGEDYD